MSCAILMSATGLALDIVGALLIWFFVAEVRLINIAEYKRGVGTLTVPDPSEADIAKYVRSVWLSRIGIILLVIGFGLQLAGALTQL